MASIHLGLTIRRIDVLVSFVDENALYVHLFVMFPMFVLHTSVTVWMSGRDHGGT